MNIKELALRTEVKVLVVFGVVVTVGYYFWLKNKKEKDAAKTENGTPPDLKVEEIVPTTFM